MFLLPQEGLWRGSSSGSEAVFCFPILLMSHQRLQLQQAWGFGCSTPHQEPAEGALGAWLSSPSAFPLQTVPVG